MAVIFNPTAPLDEDALKAGQAFKNSLPAAEGHVNKIYLHWTVAPFGCLFSDYNAEVDLENGAWVIKVTNAPNNNATNNANLASHTYHRNGNALGISIAGMDQATAEAFGPDPLQLHELEYLCAGAAALARHYNVQCDLDMGGGEHTIMTHAEAALQTPSPPYAHYYCFKDGSDPDCRWDLATFNPGSEGPTEEEARAHGDMLRQRVHLYGAALK